MRNAHIAYYFRKFPKLSIAFSAKLLNIFPLATGKNILYIYFFFISTTTYNLNESRLSIVMLLQTVFNGTLLFILNLGILNTKAPLLRNY